MQKVKGAPPAIRLAFVVAVVCAFFGQASAVEAGYRLNPGDVLQITVWKEDGMDRETLVLPDGNIAFPLVGTVRARGRTVSEVAAALRDSLARNQILSDAQVTVAVKQALGNVVDVIGQVNRPGELQAGHALTIMQALSLAGGLTPYAAEARISVLRKLDDGREISIHFKHYDALLDGRKLDQDLSLLPGDTVVVPAASLF